MIKLGVGAEARDVFTRDFHILRSNDGVIYADDNLWGCATDVANPGISSLRVATLRENVGRDETGLSR